MTLPERAKDQRPKKLGNLKNPSEISNQEVPERLKSYVSEFNEVSLDNTPELKQRENELRDEFFEDILDERCEELSLERSQLGSGVRKDAGREARMKARKHILDEHRGEPCPVEMREMKKFLSLFAGYDLDNPKIRLPVEALLRMVLSSLRMQLYTASNSLTRNVSRGDGVEEELNAVEKEKRKYDKEIIKGVKDLFRMLEGEKVTVSHDFTVGDLVGQLRDGEEFDVIDVPDTVE